MRYVEHSCRQGERWDHIALAYYGSGRNIRSIIRANPEHRGRLAFDGGEVIKVPVIDAPEELVSPTALPAWKR